MTIDDIFQLIQATCEKVYHCDVVLTRYCPIDNSVVISQIRSLDPKKGNGTKCMNYLIEALAHYGIKRIDIVACPLGGMGPKEREKGTIRLVKWYKKFGFDLIRYSKCGDYIANAEMELCFNPPSKLVVTSLAYGTRPPTIKEE